MTETIILGLGSSQDNRLEYLRQAIKKLAQTPGLKISQVAPVYISEALLPENAPEHWKTYYLNSAVQCSTTLPPQALLSAIKAIERSIGRKPAERWAPRVIDIDILSYGKHHINEPSLVIPHVHMLDRPFVLWPFLDVATHFCDPNIEKVLLEWGDRFSGRAPFKTRQINQQLIGPRLVGIINLTLDSFSNDGLHDNYQAALAQARQLFVDGAAVLDIGAESTNPNASALTSAEECKRLLPFLEALKTLWREDEFKPIISVDTYHAETVEKILAYDVDWINDVSTQELPAIARLLQNTNKKYIFTHNLGVPVDRKKTLPTDKDPVQTIFSWGAKTRDTLLSLSMQDDQLIFDVGIGFGTSPEQSIEVLRRIAEFQEINLPIYIGHSRKSFMQKFTSKSSSERDYETSLVTNYLANKPVDYLRVHNVELNNRAIKIANLLSAKPLIAIKDLCDEAMGV